MDFSDPSCLAGVSEHSQQVALLSAVAQIIDVNPVIYHPLKWLHSIPNGGDRDRRTAANMKAEGVKAGVADLCLPCARKGYHGLYLEMKNASGVQSKAQKEFQLFVESEGYLYGLFHNWQDALRALLWYLDIDLYKVELEWTRSFRSGLPNPQ